MSIKLNAKSKVTTATNSVAGSADCTAAVTGAANDEGKKARIDLQAFHRNFFVVGDEMQSKAKPSDKDKKAAAVEKVVEEGVELGKLHERYNDEYVVRGNKALYDVLASIYAYALRINESALKEKIIERLKKELKEQCGIKTTVNTHWLTTVVKFIVRTDRQTASNYSRVLQVAFDEDLAASDLAAYIERRGGVAQIRETEAAAQAAGKGSEIEKQRTLLVREFYEAMAHKAVASIEAIEATRLARKAGGDASKEKDTETSSFCHCIAVYDEVAQTHNIVAAFDFGKTFEDVILKHISKFIKIDNDRLRMKVAEVKAENTKWLQKRAAERKAAKLKEEDAVAA
jgi:hypothetical protein